MTAGNRDADTAETVTIVVIDGDDHHELTTPAGQPLRDALLDAGFSPYTRLTERANCGGRGLCATCGVRLHKDVAPDHWHDKLASRFGYPRLSCQLDVQSDLVVELDTDKRVWGRRE